MSVFLCCNLLMQSFWKYYSTFSSARTDDDEDETVNIFSVASGHLYERFLRIMMVSVLRHTETPVKFWFLKNFLSPSFKVNIVCKQRIVEPNLMKPDSESYKLYTL